MPNAADNNLWKTQTHVEKGPTGAQMEKLQVNNQRDMFQPTSPKPPQAPQVLHKPRDLDLGNVEAIPYIELHTTSPLLPPMLEDIRLYLHFPGPPSQAYTPSGALMFGTHFSYGL
ncbi:hypothetical protein F5051DRAFT_445527 [Lentinula edodes]|nr:hypothetical protein F5051DRAFT_445527 [Lentinula edodes]